VTKLDFDTLDEDGYPTDDLLDYIEHYNIIKGSALELIKIVYDNWSYPYPYSHYYKDFGGKHVGWYRVTLCTGGWSGNELLIHYLQSNKLFWTMYWQYSERGGKYQFIVDPKGKDWDDV
jgi:hypothetical protein